MNRFVPSVFTIVALSLPLPPANADAGGIALSICGDGVRTVQIPQNPTPQPVDDHQCCGKACHAGCERKRKGIDKEDDGDEAEE